jgi:hypothetical protein
MMNPLLGWAGLFGISSARKRGLELLVRGKVWSVRSGHE